MDEIPDRGGGVTLNCTPPLTRKEGLTDESTVSVTARGVVVTTLMREGIGVMALTASREALSVGVTVTTWGVVKAEAGAMVKAELEQGVLRGGGIAPRILNRCNINKSVLKSNSF